MNQEEKNEKISEHHYLLVDAPLFPRRMVPQRVPVTPLDCHSVITVLRSAKQTKDPFVDEWVTYMLNKGKFALYYGEEWLGIPDDYRMEKFIRGWRATPDEARGINMRRICGINAPNAQKNRVVEEIIEKDPVMEIKVDPPQGELKEVEEEETLLVEEEPQGECVEAQEGDRVMAVLEEWFPAPEVQLTNFLPRVDSYDHDQLRGDQWAAIPKGVLVTVCAIEGRIYGINAQGEMLSRAWAGPSAVFGEAVWGEEIVFTDLWYKGSILGGRTLLERMSYLDGTDVRRVTYRHVRESPEVGLPGVILRHGRRALFRSRPRATVVWLSDTLLRVRVQARETEGYAVCPASPALRLGVNGVYYPIEGWNGDSDIMVGIKNGVFRQLCHGWKAASYATQRDVDAVSERHWQRFLPRMQRLAQWWQDVICGEPPPLEGEETVVRGRRKKPAPEQSRRRRPRHGGSEGPRDKGGPGVPRSGRVAQGNRLRREGSGGPRDKGGPGAPRFSQAARGTRGRPSRGRNDKMRAK